MTAPLRNATNDVMDRATDISGAPAAANARKTTLPVMFAVKMWPSARKLTASTVPLTAVNARSPTRRRSVSIGAGSPCTHAPTRLAPEVRLGQIDDFVAAAAEDRLDHEHAEPCRLLETARRRHGDRKS